MKRKPFFKERTVAEVKGLRMTNVYRSRGLVNRIMDLDPSEDAICLRVELIPGRFKIGTKTRAEASRKAYKHGQYFKVSQPTTQRDAVDDTRWPGEIIRGDLEQLTHLKEEEVNIIGFSFKPVQGNDRRKRVFPLVNLLEGTRLFSYMENLPEGVKVKPYTTSRRVEIEGGAVIVEIPSRRQKVGRYSIKLDHVPITDNMCKQAIAWSLNTSHETGRSSPHELHNIRYTYETDREGSDIKTFTPQDMAAYLAVCKYFAKEKGNRTPLNMAPFVLPSKIAASFYGKLRNNVLIYDITNSGKDKLRKPHLAESSILLARAISVLGREDMFWNPDRDKDLSEYDWGKAA